MARESNGEWYVVAIPACGICAALSIAMFIHLVACIAKTSKPKQMSKMSKRTVILMITCCCFSMLGCMNETLRFSWSYHSAPDNLLHNKWVNIGDDVFHFGGQFLFYVVSLFRIKAIFNGTPFKLKKWLFITFMLLICIQLAWNMWHVVNVIIAFFFLHATNEDTLHNVMVIPVMLMCVFSFVLNFSLVALFNLKLYNFIEQGLQIEEKEDLDAQQRREIMLDVLIKCNLLFGTAIFTNELFYLSLIVNKYTEFHGWYVFLARCLENFSNIGALYLSHAAGKRIYQRLCGVCHRGVKNSKSVKSKRDVRMLSVSVAVLSNNDREQEMPSIGTTTTTMYSDSTIDTEVMMESPPCIRTEIGILATNHT